MFLLERNPDITGTIKKCQNITERTRGRLYDSTAGIVFDEKSHTYTIGGTVIPSVSSIVHRYSPFDKEKVASDCSRNPKSEYYGMSVSDIIALWEKKSDEGSAVHEFGEACYLYMTGNEDLIEGPFASRLSANGIVAESPKEIAIAKWWASQDWKRLCPIAKETMVYNPLLNYAGTFDLLLYDCIVDTFILRDYKTNKDLLRWFGKWLSGQFYKIIKDSDEGKYTIQQNLYSLQLRNIGINISERTLIWLREDGTFNEVPIPDMEKLVNFELSKSQNK